MQRIRTPSIANTANFQGGLLSAQWVLHESQEHQECHRAAGSGDDESDYDEDSRAMRPRLQTATS